MAKRKEPETDPPQPTAGRPRDEAATAAILRSAIALGKQNGFETLSVEGVAARAGVGKATIYRRWPNVWAIVADALLAEVTELAPVIERPTARESFTLSMRLVAKAFRGAHGELIRPLAGRAQFDEALRRTLADRWILERRKISRDIVRRGMKSGELRSGLDPDTVIDALYGPLYHRLLLPYDGTEVRLSDAYVDQLVDIVFGGICNED